MKFMKYGFVTIVILLCNLFAFSFVYGQESIKGVVIADNVNVREEPNKDSAVVNKFKLGEYTRIIENNGQWYRVALNDEKLGWVHNKLIVVIDEEKNLIKKGIVKADSLNVRQQADMNSNIIKKINNDTEVTITNENSGWYCILLDDENKGWVSSEYITIKPNYKKARITGSNVNVRINPSDTAEIVETLEIDSNVLIKDFQDSWYNVVTTDQKEGFVYKDYINIELDDKPTSRGSSRSTLGMKVVNIAKNKLGKRYVYGATGENSFDCSGFTSYVYKKVGIKLNRVSTNQAKQGQKVSKSNLRAGDLVCFNRNGSGKVNHVGIYIGNGEFIHASSGKAMQVIISNLNKGNYKKRYSTARRFF